MSEENMASRELRSDASGAMPKSAATNTLIDINGKLVDGLIAALLRASGWLCEIGRALELQDANSRVAESLILESGYARLVAMEACGEQNAANSKLPADGALEAPRTDGNSTPGVNPK